ncbi:MAG TPA: hypothetical protein VGR31_03770 [Planctomycetota bacterium]|jgi:hypothetical protein|nr:hypothetical protein [Planctomycetota bacterium]
MSGSLVPTRPTARRRISAEDSARWDLPVGIATWKLEALWFVVPAITLASAMTALFGVWNLVAAFGGTVPVVPLTHASLHLLIGGPCLVSGIVGFRTGVSLREVSRRWLLAKRWESASEVDNRQRAGLSIRNRAAANVQDTKHRKDG